MIMPFFSPGAPNLRTRKAAGPDAQKTEAETLSQSMTRDDASDFIAVYRETLREWSRVVTGSLTGDGDELFRQLDRGQDQLAAIALTFPDFSYEIDTLIKSRRAPVGSVAQGHEPTAYKGS